MNNNQISLRISGTKERKAGFAPLVMSGVLPQAEETSLDRALTGCNGLGYIIKHTPKYSFYMAIDGKVRSFDAAAPGVLTIAFTIPAGMKLADDKTPYDLLTELHSLFVNEYMTETGDGRHAFQNAMVDAEPFKAVLNRYSLEKNDSPTITMNPAGPTGKLDVPQSKMQDFFKDSFYPEFKNFKDIEVGDGLPSSTSLNDIKIPRPIIYKIYVNGAPNGEIESTQLYEPILANAKANSRYCYAAFKFTLKELLDNGGLLVQDGTSVMLDKANERILCELKKIPITYKVNVRFGNGTFEQRTLIKNWLDGGKIKLIMSERGTQVNGRQIDLSESAGKGYLELYYDELNSGLFDITPKEYDDYNISVKIGDINTVTHESTLSISLRKIERKITQPEKVIRISQSAETIAKPSPYDSNKLKDAQSGDDDNLKLISNSEEKKNDPKMALIFGILLGLIIGFGIGFCVDRYLISHEPTKEQEEMIRQQYREKFGKEIEDSLRIVIKKELESDEPNITDAQSLPGDTSSSSGPTAGTVSPAATGTPPKSGTGSSTATQENINTLKNKAVEYFNNGKLPEFKKLCEGNNYLKQYSAPGVEILKILFKENKRTISALQAENFLDQKGNRGEASKIKDLSELNSLRDRVKSAVDIDN